jgi:hypothetical protein
MVDQLISIKARRVTDKSSPKSVPTLAQKPGIDTQVFVMDNYNWLRGFTTDERNTSGTDI